MRDEKRLRIGAIVLTLAALVGAVVWVLLALPSASVQEVDTSAGIAFLMAQEESQPATEPSETAPPSESEGNEPTEDNAALRAEYEARIATLLDEETDIWAEFDSFVILGDSRAVGFYYFDFLDHSRVLAGGGDTIRNVEPHMDEILALQPEYIFLCYGLNDVSIGYWDTPEEYAAEMAEVIGMLHEKLPDATVVVSSILPARDPAFERSSRWYQIPDFSAAVGEICPENDAIYVDNNEIVETYADYWQPDGIHVRPEFYPYWARNLIVGIVEHEMEIALS